MTRSRSHYKVHQILELVRRATLVHLEAAKSREEKLFGDPLQPFDPKLKKLYQI